MSDSAAAVTDPSSTTASSTCNRFTSSKGTPSRLRSVGLPARLLADRTDPGSVAARCAARHAEHESPSSRTKSRIDPDLEVTRQDAAVWSVRTSPRTHQQVSDKHLYPHSHSS